MKWLWITGWAISPSWFEEQARHAWPDCEHKAVSPTDASATVCKGGYDMLAGYSLGALWLLHNASSIPAEVPVVLLAPIFAFTAEAGSGGRVSAAALAVQRRRLLQDAPAAVADFFARAGLGKEGLPEALQELTPQRIAELMQELDWLRDWTEKPWLPAGWQAYLGENDALLDAASMKKAQPDLRLVSGAGHALLPLLHVAAQDKPIHPVVRSFNDAADNYEASAGPQAALAESLAKQIKPNERHGLALELGAGTGLLTRRLQPWRGTYLATDAAPRMVIVGRQLCPTVKWQRMDASTPASPAPASWIFACNLLQWLDEPEAALRRWRALAAPEGRLGAAILLPETLGELRAVLPEMHLLAWRSAEEWQQLLNRSGFAIEHGEIWEHTSQHASALSLLRDLHAMGLAPWRTVGPGRLRAAMREYDRRFSANGGVRATWRALLVRATVPA